MRIAIAGGTGCVGRCVDQRVRELGHEPVVLARSRGVDLVTGNGLSEALAEVDAVIDVANVTATSRKASEAFFEATTTNLLAAGHAAGVRHHVALSIVGIDRVDFGYYFGKRRQEELVLAGLVPATVLRATQFHEFAAQMIARGGPITLVPKMLSQPVAAREVAGMLVDLALGEPAGMAPELAGPEPWAMPEMVRRLRDARGSRRPVLALRIPGAAGKAMAGGGLLPQGDGHRGELTFADWLVSQTREPPRSG